MHSSSLCHGHGHDLVGGSRLITWGAEPLCSGAPCQLGEVLQVSFLELSSATHF